MSFFLHYYLLQKLFSLKVYCSSQDFIHSIFVILEFETRHSNSNIASFSVVMHKFNGKDTGDIKVLSLYGLSDIGS